MRNFYDEASEIGEEKEFPFPGEAKRSFFVRHKFGTAFGLFCILIAVLIVFILPPKNFPEGKVITIPEKSSAKSIGKILGAEHVVKSPVLFSLAVSLLSSPENLDAGDYVFRKSILLPTVISRVTHGIYGIPQVRVTFPEGTPAKEMAEILAKSMTDFDSTLFLAGNKNLEGYLFPNTYFLAKNTKPEAIIAILKKEFETQFAKLDLTKTKRAKADIVTMASILEREARNAEEARTVAGILWKRLDRGIPLQVDATVAYGLGKNGTDLTNGDLQTDGPYNTYTNKGLPAGPIGNPGLAMIRAAMEPKDSPYFYYLHAPDGTIYYAKSLAEHESNRRRYLSSPQPSENQ